MWTRFVDARAFVDDVDVASARGVDARDASTLALAPAGEPGESRRAWSARRFRRRSANRSFVV